MLPDGLLSPSKLPASPPPWIFFVAIAVAAVLFGLGHLPLAASLWPLTFAVVLRTILLNAIGGIVFGWLFWRWGFECAVIAHLAADFALQGLGAV